VNDLATFLVKNVLVAGDAPVCHREVGMMMRRAWFRVAALTAAVLLGAVGLAHAGPGGGGGGHFGGGGFHGGGHGGYAARGGYSWRGGWHGGYYGGGYGRWWGGWGFGLGVYLPFLPWYYATYWWNDVPYYYADGLYYLWDSDVGEYQAVQPPADLSSTPPADAAAQTGAPAVDSELFAYPRAGQSQAQQQQDKDQCRLWAAAQTQATSAQAAGERAAATSRPDYLRAEAACLEARNYSVR
jgi:hypothetical protein